MTVPRWFSHVARVPRVVLVLVLLGPGIAIGAPDEARVRASLDGRRVPFIANQGQLDARVAYYTPTFAGTLYVTHQGELVHAVPAPAPKPPPGKPRMPPGPGWILTETFVGGAPRPVAQDRSVTEVSMFPGTDPARWRKAMPTYEQLGLGEVWPGVTVALRARGRSVEKVFTVQPHESVDRIRIHVDGADALSVDAAGALVAVTGLGHLTFTPPVAYQEREGVRREVAVAYRLTGAGYGFTVAAYDRSLPLVIDPLLQSTYLGGSSVDFAAAIAIHPTTGDVYVAGPTSSGDFPGTIGGAQPGGLGAGGPAFVGRLTGDLTVLLQATYLGGSSGSQEATSLAIHPTTGDVYVAGLTSSTDFPGTAGGAQPTNGGGDFDAFVARLNGGLTVLSGATYFGGSRRDSAYALAIDPITGDVYVAGSTGEASVPDAVPESIRIGPPPPIGIDAFVARLDRALGRFIRVTSFGGSSDDLAFALALYPVTGDVYVAGVTRSLDFPGTAGGAQPVPIGLFYGFVARLSPELALEQATYYGNHDINSVSGLAIHPTTGDIYAAGTGARFFNQPPPPPPPPGFPPTFVSAAFVARLDPTLTVLLKDALPVDGPQSDASAVAIHPITGEIYVTGSTAWPVFPGTSGGAQPTFGGGFRDAYVVRMSSALTTLSQATFLGGSGDDTSGAMAIHPATGDVYVTGTTTSSDFPGTGGGAQAIHAGGNGDAFVARLTFGLASVDPFIFFDVPLDHPFVAWITALHASGITGGCVTSPPRYCPAADVTRGQIAVFLLRGIHGAAYQPPEATGMFTDVPGTHPFASWIEELARQGITGGCAASPPQYCPEAGVTRGQLAVFLLRARHGAGYDPPPATGTLFADVTLAHPFASWIEELARQGITTGCAPSLFCPGATVTRAQMAVFLVRAFSLPM